MDEYYLEQAQKLADAQVARAIEMAQKARAVPPMGKCYNCGEKLPAFSGQRFCDADCRDDWEKRRK